MKTIAMSACLMAASAAFGLTETERQYLHNLATRPRCVSRATVVVGGKTNVVETWRRGPYEWAQTNLPRRVVGAVQRNTFEERIEALRAEAQKWMDEHAAATNRIEAFRAFVEARRDKTASWTAREIYQAILDRIDGKEEAQ